MISLEACKDQIDLATNAFIGYEDFYHSALEKFPADIEEDREFKKHSGLFNGDVFGKPNES